MIFNIYSWIFPAAVFTAAGLSNLTFRIRHKRNPVGAGRNRIIWFSINISLALGILMMSTFIIDWSAVVWSRDQLYFGLSVMGVFYLSFMMKFIIGVPLVLLLTVSTLFLNVYLQDWNPASAGDLLAEFRILSNNQSVIMAEVSAKKRPLVFLEGKKSKLTLIFESLIINRYLFFIDSPRYFRMVSDLSSPEIPGLTDKIIDWLVLNSFFISKAIYSVDIGDQSLLHLYHIVIDEDYKNISIGN